MSMNCKAIFAHDDIYIEQNGKRIAKRGHPGTAQAKAWISLEPGVEVIDGATDPTTGESELIIIYRDVQIH
jgi:hypothetical protein